MDRHFVSITFAKVNKRIAFGKAVEGKKINEQKT